MTTVFNGASNVAQAGGLACLQDAGWKQMLELVDFYKENAAILRWVAALGWGGREGRGGAGVVLPAEACDMTRTAARTRC